MDSDFYSRPTTAIETKPEPDSDPRASQANTTITYNVEAARDEVAIAHNLDVNIRVRLVVALVRKQFVRAPCSIKIAAHVNGIAYWCETDSAILHLASLEITRKLRYSGWQIHSITFRRPWYFFGPRIMKIYGRHIG